MPITLTLTVTKSGPLSGECQVPGDKSISHRSIICAAIAEGVTDIHGFLASDDCLATIAAFRQMGIEISGPSENKVTVCGKGLYGLTQPNQAINCGNSGTSMRLLAGLLAGQTFSSQLTGDVSLRKRPMARVVKPLREMGAMIDMQTGDVPPLTITGGQSLHGICYELPIASAQVKSCLLFAGLYAKDPTTIIEPNVTRDHSERMLSAFGVDIHSEIGHVCLQPAKKLIATTIDVPGDLSSAAFFIVAASIIPGSDIVLRNVGVNPTRAGVIELLGLMGADIELVNETEISGELRADIRVRSAELHGIDIPPDYVSLAIDEFPILFIAAACASGTTVLREASELRVKESDRIATMVQGLQALGIDAIARENGVVIDGGLFKGGRVNSFEDHRVAMAFSIAGAVADGPVTIEQCDQIATSFPNFVALAKQLGIQITQDGASDAN